MEQSIILRAKELFPGSDIMRKFLFMTMNTRDNCALLARTDHLLAKDFTGTRDESALIAATFHVQAAVSGLTRCYSAHLNEKDCFECLSPHHIAA